jgi:hypothetical protein
LSFEQWTIRGLTPVSDTAASVAVDIGIAIQVWPSVGTLFQHNQ